MALMCSSNHCCIGLVMHKFCSTELMRLLAVLQKFRAGGYNTIVATSIAEEGLDIMEVDLVICFDANVSPLRMIQRMGRTGRKRDGRVDILLLVVHPSCLCSEFTHGSQ